MQLIRQILGLGEGQIVGCNECGEVETLYDDAQHRCEGGNSPTALTISAREPAKAGVEVIRETV